MPAPEQQPIEGVGELSISEDLDPHHFYAAYVFDDAVTRQRDVAVLIHEAQLLGYPVRYWWLSESMELQGSPDRLIVCVHHPSLGENAGMDLYDALRQASQKHKTIWDDLEAAQVDEYREFGKIVVSPGSIYEPDGMPLFPEPETDPNLLFTLTIDDVQYVAEAMLGRELDGGEIQTVADNLPGALDWIGAVEAAIKVGQAGGKIRPAAERFEEEAELPELEPRVRQLASSGWAECYDGKEGHQCNAIHVSEGLDEEGQLYIRREWASSKFGLVEMQVPDDFTPQSWGPAYVPESSDTLEEVHAHLDQLVEDGIINSEERARSERYYKRLFRVNTQRHAPYNGETPLGIMLDGGYGDVN